MPTTPKLALPYPQQSDTADVPRDIQALATKLDGGLNALGTFTFPSGADIPWSNTGDVIPPLTASGSITPNLSVSAGQVVLAKQMRLTVSASAQLNSPAGYTNWGRTGIMVNGSVWMADVRVFVPSVFCVATFSSPPTLLPAGTKLAVGHAQGGQGLASLGGQLFISGHEES